MRMPLTYAELLLTIAKGDKGDPGPQGEPGPAGEDGESAYEIWLDEGHQGTEEDFLNSLVGPQGPQGQPGEDGPAGEDGLSAYEVWLEAGHTGTVQDYLDSLVGPAGADGLSAYEVWLEAGHTGTVQDYLDSLVGAPGPRGPQGPQGERGPQGETGPTPTVVPLIAGDNISIIDSDGAVVISAEDPGDSYTPGYGINIDSDGIISVDSDDIPSGPPGPPGPQGPAGQSASYDSIPIEAGAGISLSVVNDKLRISADTTEVQQKLTAGQNITIDSDGVISATAPNAGIDIGDDYFTLTDSDNESLEVQCTPTETIVGYDFHGSNTHSSTIVDGDGGSMPASFTGIHLNSAWDYPIGTRVEVVLHKDVSSDTAPKIMISSSASSYGTEIGTIPISVNGVAKAGKYVFNTSARDTYSYVVMRAPMPTTTQCTTLAAGEFEIYINPVYKKSVVMASKDYVDDIVGNIETILGGI